jgi:hypothetical protein
VAGRISVIINNAKIFFLIFAGQEEMERDLRISFPQLEHYQSRKGIKSPRTTCAKIGVIFFFYQVNRVVDMKHIAVGRNFGMKGAENLAVTVAVKNKVMNSDYIFVRKDKVFKLCDSFFFGRFAEKGAKSISDYSDACVKNNACDNNSHHSINGKVGEF